jgi:hypothetical protein
MADGRIARVRLLDMRTEGGSVSAIGRRTGRAPPQPVAKVAEYFGDDTDTPVIEMLRAIKPEMHQFRGGENVHVSDVISKCIRKIALMRRLNMRHPHERVMDGQGITYAIGTSLHDYVKAKLIKGHPDKVWALWTCPCGEAKYTGIYSRRPQRSCTKCGLPTNVHNEIPFVHPEYKLTGSPDILLWLEQYAALYPIEVKSMTGAMFKELSRPLPDHKIQTAFYWHLLQQDSLPVVDRASILYVNKEFSFKFPYVEYMIKPSEVDLGVFWEDLEALKRADEGGPLPIRTFCGAPDAPEAKKCPVCVTCFGCA